LIEAMTVPSEALSEAGKCELDLKRTACLRVFEQKAKTNSRFFMLSVEQKNPPFTPFYEWPHISAPP
jgi:hypothetical protein